MGGEKQITVLYKFTNSPADGVKYGAIQQQREQTHLLAYFTKYCD
jgi:hypothetical protein